MNIHTAKEITEWLVKSSSVIVHGECSITLKIRDGHLKQILKTCTSSELPDSLDEAVSDTKLKNELIIPSSSSSHPVRSGGEPMRRSK
jgi:hypothetical protein